MGCISEKNQVTGNCSPTVTLPNFTAPTIGGISAETVTEEKLDGDGIFDIYMRAGMNQLNTQYEAGRIKGSDYAQAYISMTQLMMTEANKYALGMVQAQIAIATFPLQFEKAKYELMTAEAQAKKLANETDLVCQQIAELRANGETDRELKCAQTKAQEKTIELYDRQIKGFDDKLNTDIFKTMMDSWAAQGAEISPNPEASVLAAFETDRMESSDASFKMARGLIGQMLDLTDLK